MVIGVDDALYAAAITAAITAGSTYMSNEANQNAASAQQAFQFTANANQNEVAAAQAGVNREFSNNQRALQNIYSEDASTAAYQRSVEQNNLAFERNQANYNDAKSFASSAYQRAMADMGKAGLNPILAYSKGGLEMTPQAAQTQAATSPMASTPGAGGAGGASIGSAPSGSTLGRSESLLGGGAISAATQAARSIADVQQVVATTKKTEQETLTSAAQAQNYNASTALQGAQAVTEGVRPENVIAGTRMLGTQSSLNSARTVESGTSSQLNRETTDLRRAQTDREATAAQDDRNYGRGTLGQAAATSSRTGSTLGDALRSILPNLQ